MSEFCKWFAKWSDTSMKITFTPICLTLNILTVIGLMFSASEPKKTRKKHNKNCGANNFFFIYLLTKSWCDFFYLLSFFLQYFLFICIERTFGKSYFLCKWFYLISFEFVTRSLALSSMLFEICANFDRYLTIRSVNNAFKFLNKIAIQYKICVVFVISFGRYTPYLFVGECLMKLDVNNSTEKYYFFRTNFYHSDLFYFIQLVSRLLRDVICFLVIFILNLLTLFLMRQIISRKKHSLGFSTITIATKISATKQKQN